MSLFSPENERQITVDQAGNDAEDTLRECASFLERIGLLFNQSKPILVKDPKYQHGQDLGFPTAFAEAVAQNSLEETSLKGE